MRCSILIKFKGHQQRRAFVLFFPTFVGMFNRNSDNCRMRILVIGWKIAHVWEIINKLTKQQIPDARRFFLAAHACAHNHDRSQTLAKKTRTDLVTHNVACGLVVKELRLNLEWTQDELALEAKFDRTYIHMIENGQRSPTLDTLATMCNALGISFVDFFALLSSKVPEAKQVIRARKKLLKEREK